MRGRDKQILPTQPHKSTNVNVVPIRTHPISDLLRADFMPSVEYERLGPDALLAAPTPDHYLPLLYVLAQYRDGDEISFPVEGFDGGSMSMLSVQIG